MTKMTKANRDRLKEIAVKAAAKNHRNLIGAAIKFAREADLPLKSADDTMTARDLMIELLPPYRIPAEDYFSEGMRFYGRFELDMTASVFQGPSFVRELENLGVSHLLHLQKSNQF